MPCFHPLYGWRSRTLTASGKRAIVFNMKDGYHDQPVTVPCGKCDGCLRERARQWSVRCMHEASLYDRNCFVTLTYSDAHLPSGFSLDRCAFPLFMKRLRKRYPCERIRYFHCGEYGSESGRPHYHALLFGFDFSDKVLHSVRGGYSVYVSAELSALWPFGLSEIGSVTDQSAAYVAGYVLKKARGKLSEVCDPDGGEVTPVVPEYVTMSRRPGIGRPWLDKYMCEVFPADSVVVRGKLYKPPRFYDKELEKVAPVDSRIVRARRQARIDAEENTPERLAVREKCARARDGFFSHRGL